MANDILLGQTETQDTYDGSGVFNPSGTPPESSKVVLSQSSKKPEEEILIKEEESKKPEESAGITTGLLLYAGIALAAYFLFFKKK